MREHPRIARVVEVGIAALQIEDGRITGIYVMRNPDKLERVR